MCMGMGIGMCIFMCVACAWHVMHEPRMHTVYAPGTRLRIPCMGHARLHGPCTSQVGSTAYELQEIYGIEGQAADGAGGSEDDFDDADEKSRSECVICKTEPHSLHPLHPRTPPYTPLQVVQFGYITLFASAFPLAGALALVCNAL